MTKNWNGFYTEDRIYVSIVGETKELNELENEIKARKKAITEVKALDIIQFKTFVNNGHNLLFNNDGTFYSYGVDVAFKLQVSMHQDYNTKRYAIDKLNKDIGYLMDIRNSMIKDILQ